MRDIILVTLAFVSQFLFDASLEDGINTVSLYRREDHIQFLV